MQCLLSKHRLTGHVDATWQLTTSNSAHPLYSAKHNGAQHVVKRSEQHDWRAGELLSKAVYDVLGMDLSDTNRTRVV